MSEIMNPFDPNFGKVPKIYLGRQKIVEDIVRSLESGTGPYQTSMIYGMRGVGKTSLLADITSTLEKKNNWIVIYLAMTSDLLATLIQSIYKEAANPVKKALDNIDGVKFSAFGFELEIHVSNPQSTYQVLLEEMLKVLKSQGQSLLIAIDEVKEIPEIVNLASIYQIMVLKKYPINIMMTGLPKNVSELQNNDVLTFLLRSGRVPLGPLDLFDIKYRYQKAFERGNKEIDNSTLMKMTKLTKGYAYAFQDLGYYVWQNSADKVTDQSIEKSISSFKNDLFRNAYTKIISELSPIDRKFLSIMAHNPKNIVNISDIRHQMKKSPNYVSQYRQRLIDSQVIVDAGYGKVAFSLPFMKDFLLEAEELYEIDD
ncbi:MAG: ATP-binding protein [Lactobacillus crispatus]|nr:ATP-binding protein [Lactobacillus crispatus]